MVAVLGAVYRGSLGITQACARAGINRETYYAWLRKAAQGDELAMKFVEEFDKARAVKMEALEDRLRHADDWKAQNALLARYDSATSASDTVAKALDSLSFEEQVEAASRHPEVIKRVLEDQRRKELESGDDE